MVQGQDGLPLCLVAVPYSDLVFRLQTDIYKHPVLQGTHSIGGLYVSCYPLHRRTEKTEEGENTTTICNYVMDVFQSGYFYLIPPKNDDFQNNTIVSYIR